MDKILPTIENFNNLELKGYKARIKELETENNHLESAADLIQDMLTNTLGENKKLLEAYQIACKYVQDWSELTTNEMHIICDVDVLYKL